MNKSDLVERITAGQKFLVEKDVKLSVDSIIEQMTEALANRDRIEIRGFGSFTAHNLSPRVGRNPKTGDEVHLGARCIPHFKVGKKLRERINQAAQEEKKKKKKIK